MSLPLRVFSLGCCTTIAFLATGCGVSTISGDPVPAAHTMHINGKIKGGQQPITGSTIQLYAANTTTFQGASTPLLTQPVTTDALGNFSITGDYTCPVSNPLVYIVATGGNPGLSGNQTNPGITELSLLGSCNDLFANATSTFIFIDELTTVVGVQALAPFMTDYAHIGSSPTGLQGIGEAFLTATSEIDFGTGQFAFAAGLDLPFTTLSTVADILAACVNSPGGSSACSTLYSNTGGTSDTVSAALQIVKNPGQNTSQLYSLIPANPPFQPYFTSVPSDFSATIGFQLPDFLLGGTLDSNGHLWIYMGGYNYDTATDTSTDSAGYVQVYDNSLNPLFTVQPGTGGLYYPYSFGRDTHGHVFAINANNTVSEFDSGGSAISPAAGWPTGLNSVFSPTGPGNGYIYNIDQGPIQVDALGNIWGGTSFSATQSTCYFELNSSGVNITPANGNFCGTMGNYSGIDATDGSGNAWVLGESAIGKVDAQGNLAATAPVSSGCFNTFSAANPQQSYETITQSLGYDHVHNQLWGYSETGAGAITDAGVPIFCEVGSSVLPVIPQHSTTATNPGDPYSGGNLLVFGGVFDGAGNVWFASGGVFENGVVGQSANTYTGTAQFVSFLGELSPSGAVLTPYNAANGTYGLQPAGLGANATASVFNADDSGEGISVGLLGVDNSGNIWAEDTQTSRLLKITGLAVPNAVNY